MGLVEARLAMDTMREYLGQGPDVLPQTTPRERAQFWASIATAELLSGLADQNDQIIELLSNQLT